LRTSFVLIERLGAVLSFRTAHILPKVGLVVVLVILSCGGAARADEPILVPPRLVRDDGARYPEPALRERFFQTTTVRLVLVVDASGAVTDVEVEAPVGHGFDESAVDAGRRLHFAPATRNGLPVAARIRFQYTFAPPPARVEGVVTATSGRPLAAARVTVTAVDGAHDTTTASDGSWSLPGLRAGPIHVEATAAGHQTFATDAALEPAQTTRVVLRLPPLPVPVDVVRTPDGGAPPGATEPVEEVRVKGPPPVREVTRRRMGHDEIPFIPGARGDALVAVQALPGIGHAPAFSGQIIVRGSAGEDTAILVDGTPIPLAYHFGGLSSVVPTELLDTLDLFPGNFSAQYGRHMGGVVELGLRDPAKDDHFHGMAEVDLIDTRLLVEGPIADGWRFLAAARRSWFDLWLTPILSGSVGVSVAPVYYDYQAMVQKDFDAHQSFRLLLLGSDDRLVLFNGNAAAPVIAGDLGFHTAFWAMQARYVNRFSKTTELRTMASVGQQPTEIGFGSNFVDLKITPITVRSELSQRLGAAVAANIGVDLVYTPYTVDVRAPRPPVAGSPGAGPGAPALVTSTSGSLFRPGVYTEWVLTPWRGTRILPGLRADYDDGTRTWDVAPRLTVRQDLTSGFPRTTLKGAVGEYFQPPSPQEIDPVFGQAGLRSNRSVHYDLGLEQQITSQIDLSVDGFYKDMDRLVVSDAGNSGEGRAYGIEWMLRYSPDAHFFGWIAYTLSRSERRDSASSPWTPFVYDQTHNLSLVGSYRFDDRWRLGARFRYVTGDAFTPNGYGALDANAGAYAPVPAYPPFRSRLDAFHELDLRLDRAFHVGAATITAYVDVTNVYNYRAPTDTSSNYNYTQQGWVQGLPILPSIGVRGEL
jgi:TonB family protein